MVAVAMGLSDVRASCQDEEEVERESEHSDAAL
jgi:hypothetical protein